MLKTEILLKDLRMRLEGMHPNREKLLTIIGVTEAETKMQTDLLGPLDELKASNLRSGPFKIELTDHTWAHLTFSRSDGRSTIRVLKIDVIFRLYACQRTAMAR